MTVSEIIEKKLRKNYNTLFRNQLMIDWKPKTINRIETIYFKILEFVSNIAQFIFLLWFFRYFAQKAGFETTVLALFVLIFLTLKNKLKDF